MTESLSIQQARKLVLLSQQLPPAKQSGSALDATLAAIEHLGYIQIDTISAVQRAHHHTLWARNPRYRISHLDRLLEGKKVFEYWSHAAAYLPMRDFRYSLVRKQAIASGKQNHWYEGDEPLMKAVLKRIANEGPLMAKDFEHTGKKRGEWSSKPAKRALENLFMQGSLMVPYRVNFHKVYDLTERVLPGSIDTTPPSPNEYARFLITSHLRANGLGRPGEIGYLRQNSRELISATLREMHSSGELLRIKVQDNDYFALPASLELLGKPLSRVKLKILSPFDNLVIQRKRLSALFDFDYQIECYLPESKRRYGYFSLPVLWDGRMAARMDCRADRKASVLHINHLVLEPWLKKTETFAIALGKELPAFLRFNNCRNIKIQRTTPAGFRPVLQAVLKDLAG